MQLVLNMLQAVQFIKNGSVYVNGRQIKFKNYIIRVGDFIHVNPIYFYSYILSNAKGALNFSKLSSKPKAPYLEVKTRLLTCTMVYKPSNEDNFEIKQFPDLFFNDINVQECEHLNIKDFKSLKKYAKQLQYEEKKKQKTLPVETEYLQNLPLLYQKNILPIDNTRLIISFFTAM